MTSSRLFHPSSMGGMLFVNVAVGVVGLLRNPILIVESFTIPKTLSVSSPSSRRVTTTTSLSAELSSDEHIDLLLPQLPDEDILNLHFVDASSTIHKLQEQQQGGSLLSPELLLSSSLPPPETASSSMLQEEEQILAVASQTTSQDVIQQQPNVEASVAVVGPSPIESGTGSETISNAIASAAEVSSTGTTATTTGAEDVIVTATVAADPIIPDAAAAVVASTSSSGLDQTTTMTTTAKDIANTWGEAYATNSKEGFVGSEDAQQPIVDIEEMMTKLTEQIQLTMVQADEVLHHGGGMSYEDWMANVKEVSTKTSVDATKFVETFATRMVEKASSTVHETSQHLESQVTHDIPIAVKDYADTKINSWTTTADTLVAQEAKKISSTVLTAQSNIVEHSTSTIRSVEQTRLSELGDIISHGIQMLANILYQGLDAVVVTFSGDNIGNHVTAAQTSIHNVVMGAISQIQNTFNDVSHKTIADAAESFVALVVTVVQVLFRIISWVVLQLSGKGIPEWIHEATTAMETASHNLMSQILITGQELSQKSLAEIGEMVGYFMSEVGRFIVEVFETVMELGTAGAGAAGSAGASGVLENAFADNAATTIDGITSTITTAVNHM